MHSHYHNWTARAQGTKDYRILDKAAPAFPSFKAAETAAVEDSPYTFTHTLYCRDRGCPDQNPEAPPAVPEAPPAVPERPRMQAPRLGRMSSLLFQWSHIVHRPHRLTVRLLTCYAYHPTSSAGTTGWAEGSRMSRCASLFACATLAPNLTEASAHAAHQSSAHALAVYPATDTRSRPCNRRPRTANPPNLGARPRQAACRGVCPRV